MSNPPSSSRPRIAVIGATGAVGREMLLCLEQWGYGQHPVRAFASPRSAGQQLPFAGRSLTVEVFDDAPTAKWMHQVDFALLAAGSSISKKIASAATSSGVILIDNSSAFRMTPGVPLVVPEINPDHLADLIAKRTAAAKQGSRIGGIIANPNCSTIILLMALTPIHKLATVQRAVVSTYQAASGAGAQGMDELALLTRQALDGNPLTPSFFTEPYAFNLFSHNSQMDVQTGANVEEQKMLDETAKIWASDDVRISATCIRVPVMRAHSESVNITLKSPTTLRDIRLALSSFPGIKIIDDRATNTFPTPLKASGGNDVLIGRLRVDRSQLPDPCATPTDDTPATGFDLFIVGDQLRKGAAQNAVQILAALAPA
jgi:aspartate-semialdehyde dehydrogenase